MNRETLYELAFRYKKTKLWKRLFDDQIFAVRTEGGETIFICIMGILGDHIALSVYPGDDFCTWYDCLDADPFFGGSPAHDLFEKAIGSSCLQCSFESRDMMDPDDLSEVRAYARSRGIRLSGANAFPRFSRFTPYHMPWHVTDRHDMDLLAEGLEASIALDGLLERDPSSAGRFLRIGFEKEVREVPLFVRTGEGYSLAGSAPLPGRRSPVFPEGSFDHEAVLKKIRAKKKGGVIGCRVTWMNNPIQENPGDIPFYPAILMAVEESDGKVISVSVSAHYETGYNEMLSQFMNDLAARKKRPEKVCAQSGRTYALLADTMKKASVDIEVKAGLPLLDKALYSLQKSMNEDESGSEESFTGGSGEVSHMAEDLSHLLDHLESMEDELLVGMPEDFRDFLKLMWDLPIIPSGLKVRTDRILDRMDRLEEEQRRSRSRKSGRKAGRKRPEEPLSYVISVSPYTGCYRHIRVSADITLETLHDTIQDVFEFDNDHLYAFFMDNKAWSHADAYFCPYEREEDERSAGDYLLRELGLYRGQKFLYIFDFGDKWRFKCRVLRIEKGDTAGYQILGGRGDLPEQYPYLYDDDAYYDEEDDF